MVLVPRSVSIKDSYVRFRICPLDFDFVFDTSSSYDLGEQFGEKNID
jgi:hypothetical protein